MRIHNNVIQTYCVIILSLSGCFKVQNVEKNKSETLLNPNHYVGSF